MAQFLMVLDTSIVFVAPSTQPDPASRTAALLLMQMAGINASTGWMAAARGMRGLLRAAPALHVDETPARAAGSLAYVHVACTRYLAYVHVACTRYLTLMHTGDRSKATIDAGGDLGRPGNSLHRLRSRRTLLNLAAPRKAIPTPSP
ncbi:hypothetical protein J7E88_34975 [Streptomyces sp. ISL-10]|uniref:transposase n=1 Tax=Streptomyces sp. ISL-10 TaxID=2819172 RepID=UPI001BECE7AE|nr:hypothetical protein [Streptomyces sp. ISL-10]